MVKHSPNTQPSGSAIRVQLARVYWKAGDPAAGTRIWQFVMDEILKTE